MDADVEVDTMEAASALASAPHAVAACEAVADLLVASGLTLPSVYLLRGGRLRCYAARGYWQVIDGFAPGVGVIGKVLRSGRPVLVPDARRRPDFIAAMPGLRSQASVPLRLDGETVGVLSVESFDVLSDAVLDPLAACADALAARLHQLGGLRSRSLFELLADHVAALSNLAQVTEVERHLMVAARELSGMGTALVVWRDPNGELQITASGGPMAAALHVLDAADLAVVAGWVAHGTSCWFIGGAASRVHDLFARAGAGSVLVLPLTTRGSQGGVLVLADERVISRSPERVKLVEQLAAHGAATLQAFETVESLRTLAFTDVLTGVGSAAAFSALLDADLDEAPTGPTALCVVDVDHFKAVNDTYGHVAGDQLLVAVADTLTAVAGDAGRVYRIGGDEFAVVVPADAPTADRLGARLCVAARASGRFTLSVGVSVTPQADRQALAVADAALYQDTRQGRDGSHVVHRDRGDVAVATHTALAWTPRLPGGWARPPVGPTGRGGSPDPGEALQRQMAFSRVITNVLERFATAEGDDVDDAITEALERLGRFAGVDRSYVFRFSPDLRRMTNTHEWCAEGITPQIANLRDGPSTLVEDWMPDLHAGRTVHVPRVADLPDHMADLRTSLERQEIKSLVVVPLVATDRLLGFIGFDAVAVARRWSRTQITLLRSVAAAMVGAIFRHEAAGRPVGASVVVPAEDGAGYG
jgi:diguanylate cyclase (GGDEF)-like protein